MRADEIDVVAPNLKRRLSGVTATIARLVPLMAREMGVVAAGPGLPGDVPRIPLARAATLPRDRWRVWHARRNTEMLLGIALRKVLRRRYRLLFTSASQRVHTRHTKRLIARMDAVISTSSKTAGYLDRPSHVILHGIDAEAFAPSTDRAALRARLGLPDGLLVGCFGRIRAQKGTDVFLNAALPLLKSNTEVSVVILGRAAGAHREFLETLKRGAELEGVGDRVLFPGEVPVDEIADWYAALDIFVAPQRWEGFGLTPLEAMACAVPVVATTVGAFGEIVPAEAGLLVPPGEAAPMSAAISRLAGDEGARRRMGVAGRAHVLERFTLEREANEIMGVYRRLLDIPSEGGRP